MIPPTELGVGTEPLVLRVCGCHRTPVNNRRRLDRAAILQRQSRWATTAAPIVCVAPWRSRRERVMNESPKPTVAFIPAQDRFEDFFDKIKVSLDSFQTEFTGGWLFNYIDALRAEGIRSVLFFMSSRVSTPRHFTHTATGTPVRVLPVPILHRKVANARHRFRPESRALQSIASYLSTPLLQLKKELRREGCGVILCQEYESPRFDLCVPLGAVLRMPVFATFQGATAGVSPLEVPLRRLAMRGSAGLIVGAQSEIARARTRYRLPGSRFGHIPNAFDTSTWRPLDRAAARAELGWSADARIVGWHGRVQIERKGLDVLLEAWERICAERPGRNLLLLMIGSGRDDEDLRRRVASSGLGNIVWIDRYVFDRALLWRYLSAADVYALPSRAEGFPVAAIEAMACGLPIVASDVSGVMDMLDGGEQNGGVIVPPDDPHALAAALGRVLDDEAWGRKLGAAARLHAEQTYSLDVIGRRLWDFMSAHGNFHTSGRL